MKHLPMLYVAVALWVALLLAILTPPFGVPDEGNHVLRALQVAHGVWVPHPLAGGASGVADAGVLDVARRSYVMEQRIFLLHRGGTFPEGRVSRAELAVLQQMRWSHHETAALFRNTAPYPPTSYLPQAFGLRMGEAVGMTVLHSELLGRVCAALVAVTLGGVALSLCRCARPLLFALLLLPTVLSLNGSNSQDALLSSFAALALAITTRPLSEGRLFRRWEIWAAVACVTADITARPPYLPLALLLLLPSLQVGPVQWRTLRLPLCGLSAAVTVFGIWEYAVHPVGIALSSGADPAAQLHFLLYTPFTGLRYFLPASIHAVITLFPVGLAVLGANDVTAPPLFYVVLLASVGMLAAATPVSCLRGWRIRAAAVLVLFASAMATALALYLSWTPPRASYVEGLQARYFLPLMIWGLLLLPGRQWLTARSQELLLRGALAIYVASIVCIPWLGARVFYRLDLFQALVLAIR